MIKVTATATLRGITLPAPDLAIIANYFDEEHENFAKACAVVHRKTVFQILIRILRLCNVDTGRLRASFTVLMDKWGFQNYQPYMRMEPLEGSERKTPKKGFNDDDVQRGKSLGEFIDEILDTTITSNVFYASFVNERSQFLTKALVYGDALYQRNFERFFDAAAKQGWIPEQDLNHDDEGQL